MIKRGEIYYADLRPVVGSEQGGIRPVLIIQNDIGNKYSPTTMIATLTSKSKPSLPTHVLIHKDEVNGLESDSTLELEQIRTIDKRRIKGFIGILNREYYEKVKDAIEISFSI